MRVITIPNLDKYQHYKDRNLIWVKLYVDTPQDYKFSQLHNGERWLFVGLILLAVKNDGQVPLDYAFISREICFSQVGLREKIAKMRKLKLIAIKRISSIKQPYIPIRVDKIRKEESDDSSLNKSYKEGKEVIKKKMDFPK